MQTKKENGNIDSFRFANGIKVTKLSLPNSIENWDTDVYPFKFVQAKKLTDFYMGLYKKDVNSFVIYYIADDKNPATSSSSSTSSK